MILDAKQIRFINGVHEGNLKCEDLILFAQNRREDHKVVRLVQTDLFVQQENQILSKGTSILRARYQHMDTNPWIQFIISFLPKTGKLTSLARE